MTTPINLNISGWTRQPVGYPILDGNFPHSVRSGSGTGNGLTPTHYAAPYAQVSGAISDEDVVNGTAYVSATSSSAPCTAFEAAANAVAGNIIQVAAGALSFTDTGLPQDPCWVPTNSGTSLDPIIFVAEYPAAYNSTASVYTRLERAGDLATNNNLSSIFGSVANNYITFDGFHVDYAQNGHPSWRGICYINESDNFTVRRMRFDRADLGDLDNTDNFNCIQMNDADAPLIENNQFMGGYSSSASQNESCITTYYATNYIIRHNLFDNVSTGLYLKGGINYGETYFNKFVDVRKPIKTLYTNALGNYVDIYQNLVYYTQTLVGQDYSIQMQQGDAVNSVNTRVYNNTFIVPSYSDFGGLELPSDISGTGYVGCTFRDNIVACIDSGLTAYNVFAEECTDLSNFAQFDFNWYYNNGSDVRFRFNNYINYNDADLTAWRAISGLDTNSSVGNPGFEDAANYDFRLATGSGALTASSISSGPVGCYITGTEEIGLEASPSY